MGFKTLMVSKKNKIGKITLNRPEIMNCFDKDMLGEIEAAANDIEADNEIRVLVLTGTGKAFCVGADLRYQKEVIGHVDKYMEFTSLAQKVMNRIENLHKPVIAAVNGYALAGGLEFLMCCDIVIAAENAILGDQHSNFGVIPGGGSTQRLPRFIGIRKAKELLFTGSWISAMEAAELGLINKVVPADKLEEAVVEMASNIVNKSPTCLKTIKNLVNRGLEIDLDTGLELECQANVLNTFTEDFAEGMNAFNEKRKPDFKGK